MAENPEVENFLTELEIRWLENMPVWNDVRGREIVEKFAHLAAQVEQLQAVAEDAIRIGARDTLTHNGLVARLNEALAAPSVPPDRPEATEEGCSTVSWSSRVCERGTKCCVVEHGKATGGVATGSVEQCGAQRVHPLSSDFSIRCTLREGHDGYQHQNDDVRWDDDSRFALPPAAPVPVRATPQNDELREALQESARKFTLAEEDARISARALQDARDWLDRHGAHPYDCARYVKDEESGATLPLGECDCGLTAIRAGVAPRVIEYTESVYNATEIARLREELDGYCEALFLAAERGGLSAEACRSMSDHAREALRAATPAPACTCAPDAGCTEPCDRSAP